jgi:hypothetical protein
LYWKKSEKSETKLRTFEVNSLARYNRFAEIQRNRGKRVGERINELIKKEVEDSDPNRVDHTAIKRPLNPQNIPNPFVYSQPKANEVWREFLANLSYEDWKRFKKLVGEIHSVTIDREYIENFARIIKNGA